ncbi:MAG: tetratricopeptide repeat protein [Caldilineaceae bacterium]|nr:tetratricopeptide repeat protein [Caldilineaceae bacterium]
MTNPDPISDFQSTLKDSARLLQQNRPGEAVTLLEPLYQHTPTHPDVAINLGGAYILQRKWDRAVRVLAKAAEAHPQNVMLWINLGAAHLGNIQTAGPKQQERAIYAYERALEVDPVAPNVHYHLGLIYKERGEFNRATAFFQRALEVSPADQDAIYWIDKLAKLPDAPARRTATDDADASATADDGAAQ